MGLVNHQSGNFKKLGLIGCKTANGKFKKSGYIWGKTSKKNQIKTYFS
jgi:hypothetical protein